MFDGERITVSSAGQTAYVAFRAFQDFSTAAGTMGDPNMNAGTNQAFGFHAEYTLGSVFCQGFADVSPHMSLSQRVFETAEFTIRDNMKNQYAPNSHCTWLIAPTFDENGEDTRFDSILIEFTQFVLADDKDSLLIYDGPDTDAPLLGSFYGPRGANPPPLRSTSGQVLISFNTDDSMFAPGFIAKWKALYCPADCSGRGTCVNGICECDNDWEGEACNVPAGWYCLGSHYNSSDGCDCGCGLYDPDCGDITSTVLQCTQPDMLSATGDLFNATEGKFFTGVCLYCPLPGDIAPLKAHPDTEWDTESGTLSKTCPSTFQCGSEEQCDAYGSCVAVASQTNVLNTLRKGCGSDSDCPEYTQCLDGYCGSDNLALVFPNTSATASQCAFNAFPPSTLTFEMWVKFKSINQFEHFIVDYKETGMIKFAVIVRSGATLVVRVDASEAMVDVDLGGDKWRKIACTWKASDGEIKIYVDDTLLFTQTAIATGFVIQDKGMLTLGDIQGDISRARLWNIVRASNRILSDDILEAEVPYLVGHYRFMDGSLRDLSNYENHLEPTMAQIKSTSESTSYCQRSPIFLTTGFPVNAIMKFSGQFDGAEGFSIELRASNSDILLGIQFNWISGNVRRYSTSGADDTTGGNFGLSALTDVGLIIVRQSASFSICVDDVHCVTYVDASGGGSVGKIVMQRAGSTVIDPCFVVADEESSFVNIINEGGQTVLGGQECSLPMDVVIRDCSSYDTFVASLALNDVDLLNKAKQEIYMNFLDQPCACTTDPEQWDISHEFIFASSSRLVMQVEYRRWNTNIWPSGGGGPAEYEFCGTVSGGDDCRVQRTFDFAQYISQIQTRDIEFELDGGGNWFVRSVSANNALSQDRCQVDPADDHLIGTLSIKAYSCVDYGQTSRSNRENPWCYTASGPPNQRQVCSSDTNACNLPNGHIDLTTVSGHIHDGYLDSYSTRSMLCGFRIQPTIPSGLEPYSKVEIAFQQVELVGSDAIDVLSENGTDLPGSPFTGTLSEQQLPRLTSSTDVLMMNLFSHLSGSGSSYNGFTAEYQVIREFSNEEAESFCSGNVSLDIEAGNSKAFPTHSISGNFTPLAEGCIYTIRSTDADSIWLEFEHLDLMYGDIVELYDYDEVSSTETLIQTITNKTYWVPNWGVAFDGQKDYVVSTKSLSAMPKSFSFMINVPDTISKDCSVSSNCVDDVAKPMFIMGTGDVMVELDVDTGYLSVSYPSVVFTLSEDLRMDTWTHIALVLDDVNHQVYGYINGQRTAVTSTGQLDTFAVPSGVFFIGGTNELPSSSHILFEGQISDIQLYSTMKSVFEVEKIVSLTSPCRENDPNLLLCYRFSSRSFSAVDSSINGNDALFFGGSYTALRNTSSITSTTFATESNGLAVRFYPSNGNSTASFRFIYEGAQCPASCANGGSCVRGRCHCKPGYTGETCLEETFKCGATILLPGETGSIDIPGKQAGLLERNWFPVTAPEIGYPPLNCSWILKKSRASVLLTIDRPDLGTGDVLTIYDDEESYDVHHDGLQYDLSAYKVHDLAQFLTRGQYSYDRGTINSLTVDSAQVTLHVRTSEGECRSEYHTYQYKRHEACQDGSAEGLNASLATSLAQDWWWQESEMAFASQITPVQLYFNEIYSTSAKVTIAYTEEDIGGTVRSPYPQEFLFHKQVSSTTTCKTGAPFDLSRNNMEEVLNQGWPSVKYSRQGRLDVYRRVSLSTPSFSYVGNWNKNPDSHYLKYDFETLKPVFGNGTFTIVVNVTTKLTKKEQVLLSQDNGNYGSIVLKLGPESREEGPWIFGQRMQNEPVSGANPTTKTERNVVIAVQVHDGKITYFVNGKYYASIDTNVCDFAASCSPPIGGFYDESPLIMGAMVIGGNSFDLWEGTVHSVMIYDRALSAAALAASAHEQNPVQPVELRRVYVNEVNSTHATANTIGIFSVDVPNGELVESRVNAVFKFTRADCIIPGFMSKADVVSLLPIEFDPITEDMITFNAFDDTSVAISVLKNEKQQQIWLEREYVYDFALTDQRILDQINMLASESLHSTLNIENIWVNELDAAEAKVTFKVVNEMNLPTFYTTRMQYIEDQWDIVGDFFTVELPSEDSYRDGICGADRVYGSERPAGAMSDGTQPNETMYHSQHCHWMIEAPSNETIQIDFLRFNIGCMEGAVVLDDLSGNIVTLCSGTSPPPGETLMASNRLRIVFTSTMHVSSGTGFLMTYRYSSFTGVPDTTVHSSATYSSWELKGYGNEDSGTSQCMPGTPDPSKTWKWTSGEIVSSLNQTCYEYETIVASNEWVCSGTGGVGSPSCAVSVEDLNVPWRAVSVDIDPTGDNSWYNTTSVLTNLSKIIDYTGKNSTHSHVSASGSVQINFNSLNGNLGRVAITYSTPRIFYVAPESYTPPDGSKGDGSRERPYAYSFSELIANFTAPGDTLRLYPGRYEGEGYCSLVISKAIVIETLSGPKWTLVDCLRTEPGWTLNDRNGESKISGLSFVGCVTTSHPIGAALLISSRVTIENCHFFGNDHSGVGTVAIIAPGVVNVKSSYFTQNIAQKGSGLAILSGTAVVSESSFFENVNSASAFGTIHVGKLMTGHMMLRTPAKVNVTNCSFISNSGGISIVQRSLVQLSQLHMNETKTGAALHIDSSIVDVTDSIICWNKAGGMRALSSSSVAVSSTTFYRNEVVGETSSGGAVYADGSNIVIADCSLSENNAAQGNGGAIRSVGSVIQVTRCEFKFNEAALHGGAISIDSATDSFLLLESLFKENKAQCGGALSMSSSIGKFSASLFERNYARETGGAVFITSNPVELKIQAWGNIYRNNSGATGGGVGLENSYNVSFMDEHWIENFAGIDGGSIWTQRADILVSNSSIEYSTSESNGGAVYGSSASKIQLLWSHIQHCSAKTSGGAVSLSNSLCTIADSVIANTSSDLGGAIAISAKSVLQSSNLTVAFSFAEKGGAVYAVDTKFDGVSIQNTTILNTEASDAGGAFYFVLATLSLDDITIHSCKARFGGAMTIQSSHISVSDSDFQASTAVANGGGFYVVTSDLYLLDSSRIEYNSAVSGAAIYAFATNITVNDSVVSKNQASGAGGATTLITSNMYANGSIFSGNKAMKGGCIHADLSFTDFRRCELKENSASEAGGALFYQGDSVLKVVESLVTESRAPQGGAGLFFQIYSIEMDSCVVSNNSASTISQDENLGGGFSIMTVSHDSTVKNCTFVSNEALSDGGALYVSLGILRPVLYVTGCTFVGNRGRSGAGIYASNSQISLNATTFRSQFASAGGGGVFWSRTEPIFSNVLYHDNVASYGPNYASVSHEIVPIYTRTAEASGEAFGTPLRVKVVDQYHQVIVTDQVTEIQAAVTTADCFIVGSSKAIVRDGVAVFKNLGMRFTPGLNCSLSISAGNLVASAPLTIQMRECIKGEVRPDGLHRCVRCPFGQFSWDKSEKACHECPEGAVCFGGDHVSNLREYWRFENTTGVCDKDSKMDNCKFSKCNDPAACRGYNESAEAFRLSKDGTGNVILHTSSDLSTPFEQNQTVFVAGVEKSIVNMSYSAESGFKMILGPDENLGDMNNVKVYVKDSEECDLRFTGNLCNRCAKGYSRRGKTDCVKCPEHLFWTYVLMIGGLFLAGLIAVVLIRMTIAKSRKKKKRMSIMCKIFTSYLQLVSLASSFKLKWPRQILVMFETQETISTPGDQLISIECVLDKHSSTGATGVPIYYQKLAFFLILPVVASIIPIVFWSWRYVVHRAKHIRSWTWKRLQIENVHNGMVYREQLDGIIKAAGDQATDILLHETTRLSGLDDGPQPLDRVKTAFIQAKKGEMWDKAILSVIVLIFLLHPNITKQILLIFTCVPLRMKDESGQMQRFLSSDLDIDCDDPMHRRVQLLVGIPSLLLYTIGIPLFGFLILYHRRKQLSDPRIKLQLGFLYDGYERTFYYWEIWVMMRKVFVIFVSVFLSQIGVASQSLGATAITFFALYIHLRALPYIDPELDQLEQYSLLTSLFTLYCGLLFFHDEIGDGGRVILIVSVLISNFAFLTRFLRLLSVELKTKAVGVVTIAKDRIASRRIKSTGKRVKSSQVEPVLTKIQ